MAEVYTGYGVQVLTVSSTALALTLPVDAGGIAYFTKVVFITINSNAIRYRYDGTAPTAANGHYVGANSSFRIEGFTNIQQLRIIRVTDDAIAQITFEK